MHAVEIVSVSKTFGPVTAVDDLSIVIPEGSVYGFIGPNGSGKSTTMRMIVNIIYPDRGSIRVFGQERRGAGAENIGYLPEERGLYRQMEVQDLLEFYAELRGGRNVKAQVQYWLQRLDLEKWANKKVDALSKGMSQKVQFIATIVPQPKLLILDEPFTGLDPVSGDALRSAVLDLRKKGTTVILSTHDMNVAASLCDRIFMIYKGKKVLDGTLLDIQNQYGSNTIHVAVEGGLAILEGLPGVDRVRDLGPLQELKMHAGFDSQEVLRALVARTAVHSFAVVKPSLHEIFLRIAGSAAVEEAEVAHAS
ncbi:MAG: ATP-binding cassette domain-containing protein [Acidobacteriota bacterium]